MKHKILVVINNLGVGGAERLVVDDINEMIDRGLDVHLLTFKKEKAASLAYECKISKDRWVYIEIKTIWDVVGWLKVYRFITTLSPNKVFSHLWFSNTVVIPLCYFARIRDIISFEHNIYDSIKNKKMYFVDRLIQNLSKKVVAVSSAVKESLIKHGIHFDRIVVVHNGIDISKYKTEKNLMYREKFNLPPEAFVFVTVGRLIKQKGMDIVVQAFSMCPKDSHLLIVGQGSEEVELKKKAKDLGLSDRIHFLGIRNDIPDILACSDCFVLASRWEGLGIVVLEAMASKLPIIISNFEAGKDMIQNGFNGIIVEKENGEALSVEMQKVANDPLLREILSKNAHEKVKEFGIKEHVNKILAL